MKIYSAHVVLIMAFVSLAFISDSAAAAYKYRDVILDSRLTASYEKALGPKCVQALRAHYAANKTLYSDYIASHSRSLKDITGNVGGRVPIYHYTYSPFMLDKFSDKIADRISLHEQYSGAVSEFKYSDLLAYPRSGALRGEEITMNGWGNTETTVFYVADNPYTSSSYGTMQLTLWMRPETKIFDLSGKNLAALIMALKNEPDKAQVAQACNTGLALIALEETGVGLVDYLKTTFEPGKDPGWYYLINPLDIVGNDALMFKERNADIETVNKALSSAGRDEEISKQP